MTAAARDASDWPVFWFSPSLQQPIGIQFKNTWWNFARRVAAADKHPTKEGLSRWAPVEFAGAHRRRTNVIRVFAVVLDVDDGSLLSVIESALGDLFFIAHTTFSSTPEATRWRVIVPLDRGVDADEYDRCWRWVAGKLEARGVKPDMAARDAPHAWAIPAVPPSGHYLTKVSEGAFAEVEEALWDIPEPGRLPEPDPRDRGDDIERRLSRASKYLATMPGAISGSGGHAATFKAALVLVRGFGLSQEQALRLLMQEYNPKCAPPWTLHELRHKVKQAFQRARQPFGFLANKDRRR